MLRWPLSVGRVRATANGQRIARSVLADSKGIPYSSLVMPVTRSAIKAMRQARQRAMRRQPVKTTMKTMLRKIATAAQAGNVPEAAKLLPLTYKAIDTAAKKHIIHWKNAARKKALVAKMVARMGTK
jgi:small subunit ribosomal protein S20